MISSDRRRNSLPAGSPAASSLASGEPAARGGRRGTPSPGPGHGPVSHGGGSPAPTEALSRPHGGAPAATARPARSTSAVASSSQDSVIESGCSPARPDGKNHSPCTAWLPVSARPASASPAPAYSTLGPGVNHGSARPSLSVPEPDAGISCLTAPDLRAAGLRAAGLRAAILRTEPVPSDDDIHHQASVRSELTVLMLGPWRRNVWINSKLANSPQVTARAEWRSTSQLLTAGQRPGQSAPRRSPALRGRSARKRPFAHKSAGAGPGRR